MGLDGFEELTEGWAQRWHIQGAKGKEREASLGKAELHLRKPANMLIWVKWEEVTRLHSCNLFTLHRSLGEGS